MDQATTGKNHAEFMRQFEIAKRQAQESQQAIPIVIPKYIEAPELSAEFLSMILQYLPIAIAKSPFKELISVQQQHKIAASVLERMSGLNKSKLIKQNPEFGEEADDSLTPVHFDGKLMAKKVMAAVDEAVESLDVDELRSVEARAFPWVVDTHAQQGSRPSMEDQHVSIQDLNSVFRITDLPPQSFHGVFDGHSGVLAARYTQANLVTNLVAQPSFRANPCEAMRAAFLQTDTHFVKKGCTGGTTAVCALIRDKKLYVAWLGDSSGVLSRAGKPVDIITPHKPEREDEKQRITQAGGAVVQLYGIWRVNGMISVSRSIGDSLFKNLIIGEPDIAELDMDGSEDFLILACDGLWDVVTLPQAVEFVHAHRSVDSHGRAQAGVAEKLVQEALKRGSSDNVSVMVIYLNQPTDLK